MERRGLHLMSGSESVRIGVEACQISTFSPAEGGMPAKTDRPAPTTATPPHDRSSEATVAMTGSMLSFRTIFRW